MSEAPMQYPKPPYVPDVEAAHAQIQRLFDACGDGTATLDTGWVMVVTTKALEALTEGILPLGATANASLIAAAPDLLAALEGVVRIADRKTVEFDAARAAIAKAAGEAVGS